MSEEKKSAESNNTERVVGRPFAKGVSGNPGGRPRKVVEVIAQLEAALPEAATNLVALLSDESAKVRLAAIREVFDRTMGKPKTAPEDIDANERLWDELLTRMRLGKVDE